jgi:hypothetical protein
MSATADVPGQPTTTQSSRHPFKPINLRSLLIAIVLSAFVAGAGGYFLGSRNSLSTPQTLPSPQPTMPAQNMQEVTSSQKEIQASPTSFASTPKSGASVAGCPDDSLGWKQYSDPNNRFSLQYPGTTNPQMTEWFKDDPELVSRTGFNFPKPADMAVNTGTYGTYLQITVWKNQNSLSAQEWTKQKYPALNPELTSSYPFQKAGQEGFMVRTPGPASGFTDVDVYVADKDFIYELAYEDITSAAELYSSDLRSCWASVYNKMIGLFAL